MFESNVRLTKVHEEFIWVQTSCSAGGAVQGRLGRRGLLDTLVHKVTKRMSVLYYFSKKNSLSYLPIDSRDPLFQIA
jgi:hypothetical protein